MADCYKPLKEKLEEIANDKRSVVTLDLARYESLIDLASRIDTVARFVKYDKYVSREEILTILGIEEVEEDEVQEA